MSSAFFSEAGYIIGGRTSIWPHVVLFSCQLSIFKGELFSLNAEPYISSVTSSSIFELGNLSLMSLRLISLQLWKLVLAKDVNFFHLCISRLALSRHLLTLVQCQEKMWDWTAGCLISACSCFSSISCFEQHLP